MTTPTELAEARRIVREFLAGQRLLSDQGRIRWPFELLMPTKRHFGRYFARIPMYRVAPKEAGRAS
ncbi:hypothetical protein [Microtetraspora malaysiensis]|uniref:hypothetical protein n=1 Tax=Microtetraspora malaysiensis TaxID=161358 RepID=UPI003D8A2D2F